MVFWCNGGQKNQKRADNVTGIISHKCRRTGWSHSRHSYLVDLGCGIEIQQLEVSDLYENTLLDPPFPKTRFFEIEIDEERKNGQKLFVFQNICPVHAKRKPDWHILKFRIRRGSWTITEKLQSQTDEGETQWLYTNDFALLFVSSGGRHDLDMLLDLLTGKLDAIAMSIAAGSRIPSQFEEQQGYRDAFGEIFREGLDGAFSDTVLYAQHAQGFPADSSGGPELPQGGGIFPPHTKKPVWSGKDADLNVDLNTIDDLRDLSWLME
jgi:hypothetical protein